MIRYSQKLKVHKSVRFASLITLLVFIACYFLVDHAFILMIILNILVILLFQIMHLTLNIYDDYLEYELFPFHFRKHKLSLYDFDGIDLVSSDEVREHGFKNILGFRIEFSYYHKFYLLGHYNVMRMTTKDKTLIYLSVIEVESVREALKEIV